MSDVVINRKHYDDILADRDRLQRERDELIECQRQRDALAEACKAAVKDYERVFDGRGMPSVIALNRLQAALAMLDDGFVP